MATANEKADIARWEELPDGYFFTIAEVAKILNVSDGNVRNAIKPGSLKAIRLKGAGKGPYRIKKRWLQEYIDDCEGPPPGATSRVPEGGPTGGGLLKHITPTWIAETSLPSDQPVDQSNGCKARSSGRSCGRGGRQ